MSRVGFRAKRKYILRDPNHASQCPPSQRHQQLNQRESPERLIQSMEVPNFEPKTDSMSILSDSRSASTGHDIHTTDSGSDSDVALSQNNEISHEDALLMIETAIAEQHLEEQLIAGIDDGDIACSDMPPPSRPICPARGQLEDLSEEVPQFRSLDEMEPFHLLINFWFDDAGISRRQYSSLLEILCTLEDTGPIHRMPKDFETFKKRFQGQFSILPVRHRKIPVVPSKLPTLSPAEKRLAESAMREIYFIDPIPLISRLLRSPEFQRSMYQGMAEYVGKPAELWHSQSWGTSIRSTSGKFAVYPDQQPIFPSDVVYYNCNDTLCCGVTQKKEHIGRVYCVGTQESDTGDSIMILQVQVLLRHNEAGQHIHDLLVASGPAFRHHELLMHEKSFVYLQQHHILRQEKMVYLNYKFENKHGSKITLEEPYNLVICRALNYLQTSVSSLNLTSPLRGELEIATYGREYLVETLFNKRCISLPYQLFIDGFGLYRNMYRSLMGIYLIPACLSASERSKQSNVLPLTLGPHGSNFPDVISTLSGLQQLDRGVEIDWIDGNKITIIAFCLAFIGDMPQQQDGAGFMRPTAKLSCRQCLVETKDRDQLEYDIAAKGRYHHQILHEREKASTMSRTAQETHLRSLGMSSSQTPLFQIAPSLNLVSFFPSDPCHSEYGGISKIAHSLLIENILSPNGQQHYISALRHFPFPPGWARIQSPSHLKSYQLQEHARASIIIPLLLRCHMTKSWINAAFYQGVSRVFRWSSWRVEDIIIWVFAAIAKSNSVLAYSSMSAQDRANLREIIIIARRGLQDLLEAAVIATEEIRPVRSQSRSLSLAVSEAGSRAPSLALCQTAQWTSQPQKSKKSKDLRSIKGRPNMHIALHYEQQALEYAAPYNCNVLAGEDKHR
jgi:hypothetical protein